MKLSTARTAVYACMAAVVVTGLITALVQTPVCFILLILALTAELVFFFGWIRCPHCGRHLDRTGMNSEITHCPFCGEPLDPDSRSGR